MGKEGLWYLWLITVSGEQYDIVQPVYGRDEAHAKERAATFLAQYPHQPARFDCHPDGYVLSRSRLPGSIPVTVSEIEEEI